MINLSNILELFINKADAIKNLLSILVLKVSTAVLAKDSNDALRKEFDAYKAETDGRIKSLETSGGGKEASVPDHATLDLEFHGCFRTEKTEECQRISETATS